MTRRTFVFDPANPQRMGVLAFLQEFVIGAGRKLVITVAEPTRTLTANAALWATLGELAEQVGWKPARWRGDRCVEEGRYVLLSEEPRAKRLTAEEFKDVLTAAYKRPRLLGGIDGGIVAVGMRTSTMTQRQIGDLIELATAFGSNLGVEWPPVPAKDMAA